jgi:hypothetical protein
MKIYQFVTRSPAGPHKEYIVFVDDEDDALPSEYARPGFKFYASAENVDLGGVLPSDGSAYLLDR